MKKRFLILSLMFSVCCSCESEPAKDTGTPPGETDISVSDIMGSTEEIPYASLLDKEMFKLSYESYTDTSNPLQLEGGPYEDVEVAKPFKSVLVNENEVTGQLNVWLYPVVSENEYIGFINCDMRYLQDGEPTFFGGKSFAPILNDALKDGSIAIFDTVDGTYGIYDDNSIITLEADKSYDGTITFEQVNKEYNLITANSLNDIIYDSDDYNS